MTITLKKDIRVSGVVVPAGTTATYADDFEADQVARGNAAYAPGSPRFPGNSVPVLATPSERGAAILGAGINAAAALVGDIYQRPAVFDWVPPIIAYRIGAEIKTNYVAEIWQNPWVSAIWVSISRGNDTTGDGTVGNPYKSIKKGLQSVAADYTNVLVEAGFYDRLNCWAGITPAYHINVYAVGGPVVSSVAWEGGAWTETSAGSGTWRASRSSFGRAIDKTLNDENGVAIPVNVVASQVACEALPHSVYADRTYIYMHPHDGRTPQGDANIVILMGITNCAFSVDKRYYIRGVEFQGGLNGSIATLSSSIGANARLVIDNCSLTYSQINGIGANGVPLVISRQCIAYGNLADGFNYHQGSNAIDTKAVEIDCIAYSNGDPADSAMNDNLSTAHENCRVMRVRTIGRGGYGPSFADVGTSRSWNIGCGPVGTKATGANAASQAVAFQALDTAVQYLEDCYCDGVTPTYKAATAAQVAVNCRF